jgi:hypothetical protein
MTKSRPYLIVALAAVAALVVPAHGVAQPAVSLDRSRPITYFISEGPAESGYREGDRTLAEWAIQAWTRQVSPTLEVRPGTEASATIRVYWVPPVGGLYGEMRRRVIGGRAAADVYVLPDMDGLGPLIATAARGDPLFRDTIVYLTCVHELGHAFGLDHTSAFADIMYSFQYGGDFVAYFRRFRDKLRSRDDIRGASPFSSADSQAMRVLYPGGPR